ncbi:MAG: 23S rRNA (pseudouridine(1915)-N(3))-methyltransferase RlmH [Gemmatimonadetes bacterium]|nr:23S rRNA (pseudouridine(1915)-N(3))-methyltransferase RlmH [Gemmatimonadota bacterium]
MKITIIAVGRVTGPLVEAVAEYEARAARYWKLEVVEVDAGAGGQDDVAAVRSAEEARILARLPEGAQVVALTRTGKGMGSRPLASWLGELGLHGSPGVAFVVGGAYGLGPTVLERSRHLSVSPMTLPHEMARLVLIEQLYRAGTILRGEPYHKGP